MTTTPETPESEVERLERELNRANERRVPIKKRLAEFRVACIAQGRAEAPRWILGASVTDAGQYVVPSQDVWHFDGDTWYSYKDGDTEQEREPPEWAIPWASLPPVPEGT